MSTVAFKGQAVRISGVLPKVGAVAPNFKLVGVDLSDVGLDKFAGKKKIISVVPSLDTGVCAMSARKFNQELGKLEDTVLINVSADLPFAQKRFCESEKLAHIVTLSAFRSPAFGRDYGVQIVEGPLAGLLARAVVVLDAQNKVLHAQLVPEITQEPDYEAALKAVRD